VEVGCVADVSDEHTAFGKYLPTLVTSALMMKSVCSSEAAHFHTVPAPKCMLAIRLALFIYMLVLSKAS
jgi:hypothetical protein